MYFFYNYSHQNYQIFNVPNGIYSINIQLYGAEGGNGNIPIDGSIIDRGIPGKGGYINANIPVTPNQILYLFIGQQGGDSSLPESKGIGSGGFNGGGDGYNAGGGGGASDIRTDKFSLLTRLVVAGGGGGASQKSNGGNGGALTTNLGKGGGRYPGLGGNTIIGGHCGITFYLKTSMCPIHSCASNSDGLLGYGGSGGFQAQAGGGGGYYGGGGGGTWGGGGGGSSYLKKGTFINQASGLNSGNGFIVISYVV